MVIAKLYIYTDKGERIENEYYCKIINYVLNYKKTSKKCFS